MTNDIAIVGLACRFPQAKTPAEFWRNLVEGSTAISYFTDEELRSEGLANEVLDDPHYVKAKGMVDDIELFDAAFFGITPKEAELMDPQQRLFLECAWTALEDAGYDSEQHRGPIGLFAGASINSYLLLNLLSNPGLVDRVGILQSSIPNRTDHLTTRSAYKLNLKGPAITIQTACSTSLVTVHLACQSLLSYQCDLALAGGVTVSVPKKSGYYFQEGGVLSTDGICRPFDHRANGTVVGNGAGVVVLKRLAEALTDGDQIHAVIKGSAINNDGSLKIGYTAPSLEGQVEVIAMAQAVAGVSPDTISYIEAHGTGTTMGDPIEIAALNEVFRASTDRKNFCAIGAVKANIGHLDVAAGVAGLIKTTLALRNGVVPPVLNFERPNPQIDLENSPFYINDKPVEWKTNGTPRRAGVSSFGIGGTNAHVVLEEAPKLPESAKPHASRSSHVLVLSAATASALETATANLSAYLKENSTSDLADVAYTLALGRRALPHRRVLIAHTTEDAVQVLDNLDPRRVTTSLREPKNRPVMFMFPGQGAQSVNMGRELYETEAIFRNEVDACVDELAPQLGLDLRDILYPNPDVMARSPEQLRQTVITQPALFVTEYALAKLLMHWGITPAGMIGHSIGELVAACLAGVFSLTDALTLVAARGRLMQSTESGEMLVVPLPEHQIKALLGENLSLASVNAPSLCVAAGPKHAIASLEETLTKQDVSCRRLQTSHAFHSQMMDPILDAFRSEVDKVKLHAPTIPYISNLSGKWIRTAEATDPDYWVRHLRQTVRFGDGVTQMFEQPDSILLEVGPGKTLMTIARWHPAKGVDQTVLTSLSPPDGSHGDLVSLQNCLGKLWLAGINVSWQQYFAGEQRRRLSLPTYPFEHRRYWIDPAKQTLTAGASRTSLHKNPNVNDWFYIPAWKSSVLPARFESLALQKERSSWVLFMDECGLGDSLAAKLKAVGCEVITVSAGKEFVAAADGNFVLRHDSREDFETLLQSLTSRGKQPAGFVHLWNVMRAFDSLHDAGLANEAERRGFYSLLALAQALANDDGAKTVELLVVTNEMQRVTGDEILCPEKSMVLGACRVVPQEYKHIRARSIDVRLDQIERLAELLALELLAGSADTTVAYRNQQRWIQSFEPFSLAQPTDRNTRLKKKGVYLITGGLGGMALVFAEHLARTAAARLALVGRSAFPAREHWRRWLGTHEQHDEVSQKIRRLQELEKYGARVEVYSADVADPQQMQNVVTRVVEQFGPVNGVIHAAGVPGGGMIPLKTPEKAAAILAPKVTGTRVLGQLFEKSNLDFLFLCSSRAAVLGGFGQIDYCAANAFLDAFANYYSAKTGTFTVAADWSGWQQVGMLVNTAAQYGIGKAPLDQDKKEDHPLLARRISRTPDREVYITPFSVSESWILEEHRIGGKSVLPGVTYLEMARAAFEQHSSVDGPIELRNVFFITPMAINDDEKRDVRLVLERNGQGFKFVASSKGYGNGDSDWQDHAIGEVGLAPARQPRRHELDAIIRRCNKQGLLVNDDDREPDLGPRWQNIKKVYLGEREMVVIFELSEAFAADLERFKLHPSLLDRAAGTGMLYMELEGIYLPMSYKRLRVEQPLPRRIYAHIRETEDTYSKKETITFDVLIMDEQGNEMVEIEEFSEKRINDLSEQVRATSDKPARATQVENPVTSFYEKSIRESITPAEGVEVLTRILGSATVPQVIVSTTDLAASIAEANAFVADRVSQEVQKLQVFRALHPRPDVKTPYVAPRNEPEEVLAAIMQEALGVDCVGINDNFFELGGDSILSIQIIAQANRAGWQVTPQQIFQYQTIAELAMVAIKADTPKSDPAPPSVKEKIDLNVDELRGRKLNKLSRLLEREDEFEDADVEEPVRHIISVSGNGSSSSKPKKIDFSLFYFAADNSQAGADKYRLCLEGAKFADKNGFAALWTPERHFHESGGLYPNPAVLSATLAAITERIKLRAGSVVLPLHHSIRVAEEWSMVDNLSGGRVGVSFTSGWIPNDFAFFPERFANKREEMFRGIEEVQRLWRGERIAATDGAGKSRELRILPRPLQTELPIWLTCSGDPQMFIKAGELGLNVLTALLSQSIEEVQNKIKLYREARAAHGHDPEQGQVTLMLHTFIGNDEQKVLDLTRGPLSEYLKAHIGLVETMTQSLDIKVDINDVNKDQYLDYLIAFALERYYQSASLIGTPEKCLPLVKRLVDVGVNELACFIDFGVDADTVLEALKYLNNLKELCHKETSPQMMHAKSV
jgi:phthiocerol/phenolphthiocerol synthesis type-I polyketide synthase E